MTIKSSFRTAYCVVSIFTAVPVALPVFAFAAAPMVKTTAPGYYRIMLGDFEVTALSDGTVALPVDKILKHIAPAKVDQMLASVSLHSPLETSVNGYLVNTGEKLVLIDTGAASLFGPTFGKLVSSLKSAGYKPEQVDEIYITHMHPDHIGGLVSGDQPVFANAMVHADKHESDYWLNQSNLDKAPEDRKSYFQGAMAALSPYVKAGKFKPFEGDTELIPGTRAISSQGHTPGHVSYSVESKGKKIVFLGDLVHVEPIQFQHPEVTIQFDSDEKSAAVQRKQAFEEAANSGYLVAGAHLSFPGIGHIVKNGKAYRFAPINYSPLP
jgi:glyoxylase-like metal-dependent hydrolase (beta-lactamase superfamily II)